MSVPFGPWEHPQTYIPNLVKTCVPEFTTMLDVGGGGGQVGQGYWPPVVAITVLDIFPPRAVLPSFVLGNGLDAEKIFGAKSFDVVICCECIEHLEKDDGFKLIDVLTNVAKKLLLFTTPHGFSPQDPAECPNEPWADNPHQKHLSGWYPKDFMDRDFQVYLNGGPSAAPIVAWKILDA